MKFHAECEANFGEIAISRYFIAFSGAQTIYMRRSNRF